MTRIPEPTAPAPESAGHARRDAARMRAILLMVASVAFAVLSYAAPEFQGFTADQLPVPQPRPAVQPAGFAFAIWGVIWVSLIFSAGFGLLKRADAPDWDPYRLPLTFSAILGAGWLWTAVNASPVLTTLMIFVMLALALWALLRLPSRDRGWAAGPVGLYAGWLTAAGFVSLGVILAGYGILPSDRVAAWAMIPLALGLAAWVMRARQVSLTYPLALGWGLLGIAANNTDRNPEVLALAMLGIAALAFLWWQGKARPA